MAFLGQEEQLREYQDRFKYFNGTLIIAITLVLGRLMYLQILQGDELRRKSEENRLERVSIPAPRGMIFDRNRTLLVDNRPAFDLEIIPQYLYGSKQSEKVIKRLATLLEIPPNQISKKVKRGRKTQAAFKPTVIKSGLTRDQVAKIEAWKIDMPGVNVQMKIQRTSLYKDVGGQVLGKLRQISKSKLAELEAKGAKYKKDDFIGDSGIEMEHEAELKGDDGQEIIEVDALGRRIRRRKGNTFISNGKVQSAIPGSNLILTIDQDLQEAAVKGFGPKIGGLVALDPNTGEILAMVSQPSYDPTDFARGVSSETWNSLILNKDRPLRNKVLQDHYSPGSTFKIVSAITGLEEKVITPNTYFNCTGSIRLGRRVYHCHKRSGHGSLNLTQALAQSCNVFFYRLAKKLDSVNQLAKWARELGFGTITNLDISNEIPGLIPTEEWKQKAVGKPWTQGETLSVAIGQSYVLTTVLQLGNAFATLANGGTRYKPYLVKRVESPEGAVLKETAPTVLSEAKISEETRLAVVKGLWSVMNTKKGTGWWRRIPGAEMAGKTGTVQTTRLAADKVFSKCDKLPYNQRRHGLFAGFAPANNPVIAVAVLTEHSCSGSGGAAPIAKEVILKYLQKYHPELIKDPVSVTQVDIPDQEVSE